MPSVSVGNTAECYVGAKPGRNGGTAIGNFSPSGKQNQVTRERGRKKALREMRDTCKVEDWQAGRERGWGREKWAGGVGGGEV